MKTECSASLPATWEYRATRLEMKRSQAGRSEKREGEDLGSKGLGVLSLSKSHVLRDLVPGDRVADLVS